MTVRSYPHWETNVQDNSVYVPVAADELPLHAPMFNIRAQKGPIGVPVWCPQYTHAASVFGAETFNVNNPKYFSQGAYFLKKVFSQANGAWVVRMAPSDASVVKAGAILQCSVESAEIIQYERDVNGQYVLDVNGDKIAVDNAGSPLTATGATLSWEVIPATDQEIKDAAVQVVGDATVYPVLGFLASSAGAYGNDAGFKFYFDKADNDAYDVSRVDSLYYRLAPVVKEYANSTIDPVRDRYNNISNSFVLKAGVVDESLQRQVSIDRVLGTEYSSDHPLPYAVTPYYTHIAALDTAIATIEYSAVPQDLADNLGMMNPVALIDGSAAPYQLLELDVDSTPMHSQVVHYLSGGADGDITDYAVEGYFRNFLELDTNPDIVDRLRYKISHLYDVGWSLDTKYAMCDFMAVRDDVKIVLSSQTVMADENGLKPDFNTPAEDAAVTAALRARALLTPESIIRGTGCCRAMIFKQCGYVVDDYTEIVPLVLWSAIERSRYHNTDIMSGAPEGRPYSEVKLFKEWNWAPSAVEQWGLSWDEGGNYFQYFSNTGIFFASLRTVYEYDTSVLSSDDFTDAIIYTKHICAELWSKHSGKSMPSSEFNDVVNAELSVRLRGMYSGRYVADTKLYNTDEDLRLGYATHVRVSLTAPSDKRVLVFDIEANRENFTG